MIGYKTILASLIAFAVAVAPVAATLLASVEARAATAATTPEHDCHGKAQHSNKGLHDQSDKAGCPGCDDGQDKTKKCIGDGVKCCKLTGMVAVLPAVVTPAENIDLAASPPTLTGWQMRPPAPPPRA